MCEHINSHWLSVLPGEVYMCAGCGVIYDLADERNYDGVNHTMTPCEANRAIRSGIEAATVYLEQIRHIISEYDNDTRFAYLD